MDGNHPDAERRGRAEAVVRSYLHALGGDDPDTIAAFADDDFRNVHLSALGDDSIGRARYRERLPGFLATFPERSYELIDLVTASRHDATEVVVRYRLHAVHHDASRDDGGGPASGPDGTSVEVPGIMWLTVADGRILRRIDSWDSLTFLRQIGHDDVSGV